MAALFTLLLGASSILLGYFLYDFGHQNFIRETEAAIDNEIEHILAISVENQQERLVEHIAKRSKKSQSTIYLYRTANGTKLAGNIDNIPSNVAMIKEGIFKFSGSFGNDERIVASKIHTFPDGSNLLIARDIHEIIKSYEKLRLFSILIMSFMFIVVAVSFFISFFVVGRINQISNTARQIMDTGDLSRRISINTNWDDLSDLAQTLNNLLERVELLMQGVRDVSDSIAHDLRTPLTRLRNHLEKAKKSPPDQINIDDLLTEADHILTTFNALLRISNIEKGKRHQKFSPIDLNIVLHDVVELYEPLAEEKHIKIKTNYSDNSSISGDRNLLFQLFANLLDNAIKFSLKEKEVQLSISGNNDQSIVKITDNGIGIAEAEKAKIFDRFYRSEKNRNEEGNGLGLSLVKAIAELHNTQIAIEDNNPGLVITLRFPNITKH